MVRNNANATPCAADSRKDACWNHSQAYIEPCTHQDYTYTNDGRKETDHHQKHCTYCITAFPKEQHNFVNGVCTVCGVEKLEIGGSTSIEEISVKREEFGPATEYFDLQGRKFSGHPTQKGIYVVNGNLVVIK